MSVHGVSTGKMHFAKVYLLEQNADIHDIPQFI